MVLSTPVDYSPGEDVLVATQDVVQVAASLQLLAGGRRPPRRTSRVPARSARRPACSWRSRRRSDHGSIGCRLARPGDVLVIERGIAPGRRRADVECGVPVSDRARRGIGAFGAPWSDSNRMSPGGRPAADIRRTSSSISWWAAPQQCPSSSGGRGRNGGAEQDCCAMNECRRTPSFTSPGIARRVSTVGGRSRRR